MKISGWRCKKKASGESERIRRVMSIYFCGRHYGPCRLASRVRRDVNASLHSVANTPICNSSGARLKGIINRLFCVAARPGTLITQRGLS